jgi:lambda repressor-like predicted transcriptional regulator
MKNEPLENTIITLHYEGWPIRRLSRELRISRKRIRRVLVSNRAQRDTTPGDVIIAKKKRQSKLDPYRDTIAELLDKYPDITG